MRTGYMDWVGLLGRVLMSAIFISAGYSKATAPTATMAMMGHYGLPLPGAAYAVTLIVELGVGIMFLLGYRARLTALVLAVWCIATAMVAHYHPGDTGQMIHFMKNVCTPSHGTIHKPSPGARPVCFSRP